VDAKRAVARGSPAAIAGGAATVPTSQIVPIKVSHAPAEPPEPTISVLPAGSHAPTHPVQPIAVVHGSAELWLALARLPEEYVCAAGNAQYELPQATDAEPSVALSPEFPSREVANSLEWAPERGTGGTANERPSRGALEGLSSRQRRFGGALQQWRFGAASRTSPRWTSGGAVEIFTPCGAMSTGISRGIVEITPAGSRRGNAHTTSSWFPRRPGVCRLTIMELRCQQW